MLGALSLKLRMSRFAIVIAWALCALVVWATIDKVPDDPAVFKQFSPGHNLATVAHVVVQTMAIVLADCADPDQFTDLETVLPSSQRWCLCQAADSSPPVLRS